MTDQVITREKIMEALQILASVAAAEGYEVGIFKHRSAGMPCHVYVALGDRACIHFDALSDQLADTPIILTRPY